MIAGKPEILGEMNKKLILDHLQKNGPQSRADLSRALGLSFPAVSTNMESLLEKKLVSVCRDACGAESGIGRKPVVFEYNQGWGYVMGIDLGRHRIRMMICDAVGTVIKTSSFATSDDKMEIFAMIDERFEGLLRGSGVPLEKLKHISIGVPGILNEETDQLTLVPFLNEALRSIRIDTYLRNKYSIATSLKNSVNLAAIAEKWQGAGVGYSDIIYVDSAVGLGSALILNGSLVNGFNGAAGEIGYMLPDIALSRESYDEEGALEKILSGKRIQQHMVSQSHLSQASARDLFEGDNQAMWQPYLSDIRKYFAQTLVNLAAVVNPEVIIVGGGLGNALVRHNQGYFESFLRAHVPFPPKLLPSKLDENASVLGAVAVGLRQLHDDPAYFV